MNEEVWPKTCSDLKLRYGSADEPCRALYDAEARVVSIVGWATGALTLRAFSMDDVVGADLQDDGTLIVYK